MRILRTAMDEVHEKLQSKDGPIQFLHDRSTFYELAAVLVEGGLNIVQEEKTDITEDNCNKIISDLTEIQAWLDGRIQDMKLLIAEKDRELTDRLENELKLQQSLELKDREIFYLHEKLEPGRTKNEDIVKLKTSVDQQVSNIKQKLEDEKKILSVERRNRKTRVSSPNLSFDFLDKERNGSPVFAENDSSFGNDIFSGVKPNNNQNVLIRKMSSDIDILKATLDLAFGRMQSVEAFPLEKQWNCAIEKDVESILVKGFVNDLKRSFDVESWTKVGFLTDDWFEFIDEMRNLCYELKEIFTINDVHEKGPIILRSSSEPLSDIGEVDGKKHVAKMKKNFESIIRKQVEELHRLKREEGSFSRVGREKGSNGLGRRIQDVITRLDNFTKRDQQKSRISKYDVKTNRSFSKDEGLLELDIEKLKQERDGLCFRISVMEDTYHVLLRGMTDDFSTAREKMRDRHIDELQGLNLYLESKIGEDLYVVVFRETIKQWKEFSNDRLSNERRRQIASDETIIGGLLKEDIYLIFFREMVNAWKSEEEDRALESLIREGIDQFLIIEAVKDFQERTLRNTPRSRKLETDGDESLIQKLDSLLRCLEAEEDLMLSANFEIKEHNVNNNLVILNCEEMDERDAIEWLITDDESTFISVSEKLERALQQLYTSKELLVELEQSLKVSEDLGENVLADIVQFEGVVGNFEHLLQENLESKCFRLDVLKHEVDTLIKPVALIRKRKLLYKKAFLSRCHNLKLAEAEVDLLGDQVESLLCLLERIYFELSQNAKILSGYFEVYDILKLIKRELNDGRSCKL